MVDAILKKAVENGESLDRYTDLLGRLSELIEAERQVELQERSWKDDGTETRYVQGDKPKKPEDLNDLIEILEEAIKEKEEEKAYFQQLGEWEAFDGAWVDEQGNRIG